MREWAADIIRYREKARGALQRITTAVSAEELRDAWEDYLESWNRSVQRILSGADNQTNREWQRTVKGAINGDD
jgi:hypothetical protein